MVIEPSLDKLYQDQIDDMVWTDEVHTMLKQMGMMHDLYAKRWVYEDTLALVGLLGIVLSLILDNHMGVVVANLGPHETYHDDMFANIVKICISIDAIIVVVLLGVCADLVVYMEVLKGAEAPGTTLFNSAQERHHFMLESMVCLLHVPVGVDFMISEYMHVNALNTFMIFRCYLMLRVMRNHSGFYSQQINIISGMNGVDSMDITFNFKMLLKKSPLSLLGPMMMLNVLAIGTALTMFERVNPNANIQSFGDAVYLALVTMSTVGYGDYYPITALGQVFTIMGGVVGGTCLCTLLITVFCDFAEVSAQEEYVISIVQRRKHGRKLRSAAAHCIQRTFGAMKLRRKVMGHKHAKDPNKSCEADLLHLPAYRHKMRHMFDAIRKVKKLRGSMPDDMTSREVQDKWMAMIDEACNAFYHHNKGDDSDEEEEEEGEDVKVEQKEEDAVTEKNDDGGIGLRDIVPEMHKDIWHIIDHEEGPKPCVMSLIHQVEINTVRNDEKLKTVFALMEKMLSK